MFHLYLRGYYCYIIIKQIRLISAVMQSCAVNDKTNRDKIASVK